MVNVNEVKTQDWRALERLMQSKRLTKPVSKYYPREGGSCRRRKITEVRDDVASAWPADTVSIALEGEDIH